MPGFLAFALPFVVNSIASGVAGYASAKAQERQLQQQMAFQREQSALQAQESARAAAAALLDRKYQAEYQRVGMARKRNAIVNSIANMLLLVPERYPTYPTVNDINRYARRYNPQAFNHIPSGGGGGGKFDWLLAGVSGVGGSLANAYLASQLYNTSSAKTSTSTNTGTGTGTGTPYDNQGSIRYIG